MCNLNCTFQPTDNPVGLLGIITNNCHKPSYLTYFIATIELWIMIPLNGHTCVNKVALNMLKKNLGFFSVTKNYFVTVRKLLSVTQLSVPNSEFKSAQMNHCSWECLKHTCITRRTHWLRHFLPLQILKHDSWSTFRIYQPPIGFKFKALS